MRHRKLKKIQKIDFRLLKKDYNNKVRGIKSKKYTLK